MHFDEEVFTENGSKLKLVTRLSAFSPKDMKGRSGVQNLSTLRETRGKLPILAQG
jgi:hypothetical protein